eukprot:scaffold347373_cov19-Prasinocladus_malaysianus.AAC.1
MGSFSMLQVQPDLSGLKASLVDGLRVIGPWGEDVARLAAVANHHIAAHRTHSYISEYLHCQACMQECPCA